MRLCLLALSPGNPSWTVYIYMNLIQFQLVNPREIVGVGQSS